MQAQNIRKYKKTCNAWRVWRGDKRGDYGGLMGHHVYTVLYHHTRELTRIRLT